jgi:hypothetical protein
MALWLIMLVVLAGYVFVTEGKRAVIAASKALSPGAAERHAIRTALAAVGKRGVWFGLNESIDSLDLKLAVPVAAVFLSSTETAVVALGWIPLVAVHFFPYVAVTRYLLPKVHRESLSSPQQLVRTVRRWCVVTAVAATPLALCAALFGEAGLAWLVKGDYSAYGEIFPWLGLAIVPLSVSIVGVAAFMSSESAPQLLRWRAEATGVFVLAVAALAASTDVTSIFIAIAAGRFYLCLRLAWGARAVARV